MDLAMAPPVKRRKLSSFSPYNIHRDHCTEPLDATSSYCSMHSRHTHSHAAPISPYTNPQPNQERKQDVRPAIGGIEDFKVLLPRQGTLANIALSVNLNIAPTTAFVDASTTVLYTPPATPSLPTLPSISGATTFSITSTTSTSSAGPTTHSASSSNTTSAFTTQSPSSSISASRGLTTSAATHVNNSTTSSSTYSSTVTTASTTAYFIATLSDGEATTITRLRTAYTTTFEDGEVFTVGGYQSSRKITSATATSSTDFSTVSSTALGEGTTAFPAGAYGTPATAAPSSNTSAASNNHGGGGSSTPPAGTIAGGVVGGCAGLAVIVLIAMLFVRWYRRRALLGHQALPPVSADSPGAEHPNDLSRGPGMAERAGLMPLAAAVPALFRHRDRSAEPPNSTERGFTRISGRKLPSAWSEGMSSPPPTMPLNTATSGDGTANLTDASASYYRDSQGYYGGGDGAGPSARSDTASPTSPASSLGPLRTSTQEMMTMSPGPQRQPQVHSGGPYGFTGVMHSPAGLQRSETPSTLDPSRNSRFTEEM